MNEKDAIVRRQKYAIRFKNEDMDFILNWVIGVGQVIGLSHGEIFYAISNVKDGDAQSWREAFFHLGEDLRAKASELERDGQSIAAGQAGFGATYALRAGIQYMDPRAPDFPPRVAEMEAAFQSAAACLQIPLRPVDVPYAGKALPGYYLEHDRSPRPTLLMVGGGDTFREDLFPFAGYPGWKRGYNVLMVDLPGQGKNPANGLTFEVDASQSIAAVLDWLEANAAQPPRQVAIYGVSGGGYFTAQAAASDPRIGAWIASTPIFDIASVFKREFGAALKAPGWLLSLALKMAGRFNASAELSLKKYGWQFGTEDLRQAIGQVYQLAQTVDYTRISCPALFLVGESEAEELKRQARVLEACFHERGQLVTLREFTGREGADAHCQVNNLRLAHRVVFDWLDRQFAYPPPSDTRLLC